LLLLHEEHPSLVMLLLLLLLLLLQLLMVLLLLKLLVLRHLVAVGGVLDTGGIVSASVVVGVSAAAAAAAAAAVVVTTVCPVRYCNEKRRKVLFSHNRGSQNICAHSLMTLNSAETADLPAVSQSGSPESQLHSKKQKYHGSITSSRQRPSERRCQKRGENTLAKLRTGNGIARVRSLMDAWGSVPA
jgi:hypothetical protein